MDLTNNKPLTTAEIAAVKKITNSGELYYDYNPLIERARNWAYLLCRRFNKGDMSALRELKNLFAQCGKNVTIEPPFICEFGFNLHVGDNVVLQHGVKVIDCNSLTIGANTLIEPQVGLYTSNHALDATMRKKHYCFEQPIMIGKNCIIGVKSVVVPGTQVVDGCIVAPTSTVVGTLEHPGHYAGCPASLVTDNE